MVKRSDIPVEEVLHAVRDHWYAGQVIRAMGVGGPQPDIIERLGQYPPKVVYARLDQLVDQGLLDFGVSLRTAWLTDAGWARLGERNPNRPPGTIPNDALEIARAWSELFPLAKETETGMTYYRPCKDCNEQAICCQTGQPPVAAADTCQGCDCEVPCADPTYCDNCGEIAGSDECQMACTVINDFAAAWADDSEIDSDDADTE